MEWRRYRPQLAAMCVSCLRCRCWWSWDRSSDRRRLRAVRSHVSDAPDLHPTAATSRSFTSLLGLVTELQQLSPQSSTGNGSLVFTSEHRAWSVWADAWPTALAGYSSASALVVTVHRCLWHRAPRYLADYRVPVYEVTGRQHLQSARHHQMSVPRVHHSTF